MVPRLISIHALRAEGDLRSSLLISLSRLFLSTPSVRRATGPAGLEQESEGHFYPRPPCGGRPAAGMRAATTTRFLSTPSVRRATDKLALLVHVHENFYPRPPCGGRHGWSKEASEEYQNFYPRPPCGGRLLLNFQIPVPCNFYPRPPCGGRQGAVGDEFFIGEFLSTPSVRRATRLFCKAASL